MGNDEYTDRGNSKQFGKGLALPCPSVYSTPLKTTFCAEQFNTIYED